MFVKFLKNFGLMAFLVISLIGFSFGIGSLIMFLSEINPVLGFLFVILAVIAVLAALMTWCE